MAEKLGLGIGSLIGASILYKLISGASEKDDEVTVKRADLECLHKEHQQRESALSRRISTLENSNSQLQSTIWDYQDDVDDANTKITHLKTENAKLQAFIKNLYDKISETETELAEESTQAAGNLKTLTKERQRNKEEKKALKKKCTAAQTEKDQLNKELTQLKETQLVKIQTALDDLTNRAEAINNQNQKSIENIKRKEFTTKFQELKNQNDRMIRDLKTVIFTTRFYQSDHEKLLKIQQQTEIRDRDYFTKMRQITEGCKFMIEEYNWSIPERFLNTITNHARELDLLEKHNFNSEFEIEAAIYEKILHGLSKEREMLEGILNVEKSNCLNGQNQKMDKTKKPNLQINNNLNTETTYSLVIYNMPEASNHLTDIKCFESFMRRVTGRNITCCGLIRHGVQKKKPRSAKITLKSKQDFEDVLNSKNVPEYSHLRVQKFV